MGNGNSLCLTAEQRAFFGPDMHLLQLEPGSGYAAAMPRDDAIKAFRKFCASPGLKHVLGDIWPNDSLYVHYILIDVVFNDYEHFANCMLGGNLLKACINIKNETRGCPDCIYTKNRDDYLERIDCKGHTDQVVVHLVVKKPIRIVSGGYETHPTERLLDTILSV